MTAGAKIICRFFLVKYGYHNQVSSLSGSSLKGSLERFPASDLLSKLETNDW